MRAYCTSSAGECHSVLHFSNSTLWGGVEEHICALLRNLSRDKFRLHLVCDPVLYDQFRAGIDDEIQVTPLALSSPKHVAAAVRFAKLIRRGQFHIVHSHMFWSSLFASPISWACRVPIIVETLHGTEAWRTGWKANCVIDRAVGRLISKHVAVCASDARFLEDKKAVPTKKIAIIHNGIDAACFAPPQDARGKIRRGLGFTDADVVLIMVARFHPGKGHRVLLRAMRQLADCYPNLKLVLLGEGKGQAETLALCATLGLEKQVRVVGYQRNVKEWLAAADINVLPTFYEGLPLTILEAMAAGLPTVASRVGGIPDAIEDGVGGRLVPAGDPQSLVQALSALVGDRAEQERMGNAARERVTRYFSIEQQVRNTEAMYLSLWEARAPGSSVARSSRPASDWSVEPTTASRSENHLNTVCTRTNTASYTETV